MDRSSSSRTFKDHRPSGQEKAKADTAADDEAEKKGHGLILKPRSSSVLGRAKGADDRPKSAPIANTSEADSMGEIFRYLHDGGGAGPSGPAAHQEEERERGDSIAEKEDDEGDFLSLFSGRPSTAPVREGRRAKEGRRAGGSVFGGEGGGSLFGEDPQERLERLKKEAEQK